MIRQRQVLCSLIIIVLSSFAFVSCSTLFVNKQQAYDLSKNIYYHEGMEYLASGGFEEAVVNFDKAIDEMPYCSECYLARGSAYHQLWAIYSNTPPELRGATHSRVRKANRCYARAKDDLTTALKYNPQSIKAYLARAMFRTDSGDLKGAIEDYTDASVINPDNPLVYYLRGQDWDYLGNMARNSNDDRKANKYYDKAITDYLKAIELNMSYCTARKFNNIYCYTMGDLDNAIAFYTKIIDTDPTQEHAYILLALAYIEKGDMKNALYFIGRGSEVNARTLKNLSTMSDCLMGSHNYASALIVINIAINVIKDKELLSSLYFNRAKALYALGKYEDALSDWKASTSLNPEDILGRKKRLLSEIENKLKDKK